ncbi:uncharacterized protein LOC110727185 isoform X2 [Chenopodium quinoa]|uniref:uncharacterized protein LOC110727185 isoform X2 n=1 Tax=Chenopodium quinoa TaxID=63459 RepID=UPI000B797A93|nr:uncharacterized protein LOC110727185 isoform X2 [Chenopodium quinoa]
MKGNKNRLLVPHSTTDQGIFLFHVIFRFSYYTASTGGAGPTILCTSFLLLGEEVVAYNKGEKVKLKPYSGMLNVDFGKGINKRDVFLLLIWIVQMGTIQSVCLLIRVCQYRFPGVPEGNKGMSVIIARQKLSLDGML